MKWGPSEGNIAFTTKKTHELRTSEKPHWAEVRRRLGEAGVAAEDAAVGGLQTEGQGIECGWVSSRDGRRHFEFIVTFGYTPSDGRDVGTITEWKQLEPREIRVTAEGYPNLPAQAAAVARAIFEREASAKSNQ